MQIHVVEPGQTVYQLARAYRTTMQAIITANELQDPARLVVGQALIMPIYGRLYWVQPGDSLWLISRRYGIDINMLAQVNGLVLDAPLMIGTQLYVPPRTKKAGEVLAFLEPRGDGISDRLLEETAAVARDLTYIALFSLEARRDGSLILPPSNGLQKIVNDSGAKIMLTVSNLERGAFSGPLAQAILQSSAVQNLLLENIIAFAEQVGNVRAVMFDFEHIPASQKQAYVRFLQLAREQLGEVGILVSAALAPKVRADQPGEWFVAHDYKAIGAAVDFVQLMTYEWGYSAGPPMAVSPLPEVEKAVQYALTEIPAEKIMLGQNLYGYDWTLPFVQGGPYARAVSPQMAIQLARDNNARIDYDERAQAPTFRYRDAEEQLHEVWFEDARSIQAKLRLMERYRLRGIGYWKLGISFPQNWLLVEENIEVAKINGS